MTDQAPLATAEHEQLAAQVRAQIQATKFEFGEILAGATLALDNEQSNREESIRTAAQVAIDAHCEQAKRSLSRICSEGRRQIITASERLLGTLTRAAHDPREFLETMREIQVNTPAEQLPPVVQNQRKRPLSDQDVVKSTRPRTSVTSTPKPRQQPISPSRVETIDLCGDSSAEDPEVYPSGPPFAQVKPELDGDAASAAAFDPNDAIYEDYYEAYPGADGDLNYSQQLYHDDLALQRMEAAAATVAPVVRATSSAKTHSPESLLAHAVSLPARDKPYTKTNVPVENLGSDEQVLLVHAWDRHWPYTPTANTGTFLRELKKAKAPLYDLPFRLGEKSRFRPATLDNLLAVHADPNLVHQILPPPPSLQGKTLQAWAVSLPTMDPTDKYYSALSSVMADFFRTNGEPRVGSPDFYFSLADSARIASRLIGLDKLRVQVELPTLRYCRLEKHIYKIDKDLYNSLKATHCHLLGSQTLCCAARAKQLTAALHKVHVPSTPPAAGSGSAPKQRLRYPLEVVMEDRHPDCLEEPGYGLRATRLIRAGDFIAPFSGVTLSPDLFESPYVDRRHLILIAGKIFDGTHILSTFLRFLADGIALGKCNVKFVMRQGFDEPWGVATEDIHPEEHLYWDRGPEHWQRYISPLDTPQSLDAFRLFLRYVARSPSASPSSLMYRTPTPFTPSPQTLLSATFASVAQRLVDGSVRILDLPYEEYARLFELRNGAQRGLAVGPAGPVARLTQQLASQDGQQPKGMLPAPPAVATAPVRTHAVMDPGALRSATQHQPSLYLLNRPDRQEQQRLKKKAPSAALPSDEEHSEDESDDPVMAEDVAVQASGSKRTTPLPAAPASGDKRTIPPATPAPVPPSDLKNTCDALPTTPLPGGGAHTSSPTLILLRAVEAAVAASRATSPTASAAASPRKPRLASPRGREPPGDGPPVAAPPLTLPTATTEDDGAPSSSSSSSSSSFTAPENGPRATPDATGIPVLQPPPRAQQPLSAPPLIVPSVTAARPL